jgi:adenylate cyclase
LDFRRRYRELVLFGALVAGAALAVVTDGRVELVDGLVYDVALALAPARAPAPPPRVAVIAIDERSLASKLLESTPRVFFSPYYAELLQGLYQAGATAVGFDIIFSYGASRFAAIERNYDDRLLSELTLHRDRVVLARTASTTVAEPYVAAVFDPVADNGREEPRAIAYSELVPSEDGVQRWVYPEYLASDGARLPTLAARLAEIAGTRGRSERFLLAPVAPLESIPTYALADVLDCMRTHPDAIKSAFAGKVVLVGSNLAEEDRKRAPDRFLRWPMLPSSTDSAGACNLVALGPSAPDSDSVPGVHIHAAAVDSLLSGTGVTLVRTPVLVMVATAAAVICSAFGLFLSPVVAVGALVGFLVVLFVASVGIVTTGQWLPIAVPAVAALLALLGGQLARFLAEDRRRQRLESAFGCYLAPAIVSQLADAETDLKLGGEEREITVMFADLNNFTTISDTMGPAELMELTNRYFKVIVDVIDEMGGYVDKFIGDSVMALFGAPAGVPNAQACALQSALLIQQRVQKLKASGAGKDLAGFDVKVGISSGRAIVGNVGAPRRLSYTALGATVNLAARLEKVCTAFGCSIVVDAATMSVLPERYLFCELDSVTLKGLRLPVAVYEAIAPIESATPEQRDYVARYQAALHCYRTGETGRAAELWLQLTAASWHGAGISPASVMAKRALAGEPALPTLAIG